MQELALNIVAKRQEEGYTQEDMAKKMGISLRTYQRFESNPGSDMTKVDKFASFFGMDALDLMGVIYDPHSSRVGQQNKRKDKSTNDEPIEVPIVKLEAGAGEGVYNFHPQRTLVSLNPSIFPFVGGGNTIAVEIIGDSMEPDYRNGDYILIAPINGDRRDDGVYAIRIDGMLKVKRLQFKLNGDIDIISINKSYPVETYIPGESQIDFEIIGAKKLHISR